MGIVKKKNNPIVHHIFDVYICMVLMISISSGMKCLAHTNAFAYEQSIVNRN